MCGITGFIDFTLSSTETVLKKMTRTLSHRGPDDSGEYFDQRSNVIVGLGHRRLSIQDLSLQGHQPMEFDGFVIAFNGEIYNFKEVRVGLEKNGYEFQSSTDTEVILKAFHCWGADCVKHFIGMFVFVIYDKKNSKLTIFRDRAGVKPLYYYWNDGLLLFGSELKVFHQHSKFNACKAIDSHSLSLFLMHGYIPSPHCIFENTSKLPPGHYLEVGLNKQRPPGINQYWSAFDFLDMPRLQVSNKEAEEQVHKLLISACNYRMVSDVPVGIFLSGGYDSSLVTAILQQERTTPIKTFTIGFDSKLHNEAGHAESIAKYLGTDHHSLNCSNKDFMDVFHNLPDVYDEPMADDSAIPTLLLSEFAKHSVNVAISADGGDELFAGYNRYRAIISEYSRLNKLSASLANNITAPLYHLLAPFLSGALETKISKIFQFYALQSKSESISNLVQVKHMKMSFRQSNTWLNQDIINPLDVIRAQNHDNNLGHALAADYYQNMSDAIIVKVERASMAYGLEAREPLLDHRLYEFVAQLPDSVRNKPGQQKSIIKSIAHKYIPESLLNRPKQGFTPPLQDWVNTQSFIDLKNTFLCKSYLQSQGIFSEQLALFFNELNTTSSARYTYNLLVFQTWYERWMN